MEEFKFTDESFEKFKQLYEKSEKDKSETFEFEGHQVLTLYAKYVIEYIEWNDKRRTSSTS
jgi:hypothetical protein